MIGLSSLRSQKNCRAGERKGQISINPWNMKETLFSDVLLEFWAFLSPDRWDFSSIFRDAGILFLFINSYRFIKDAKLTPASDRPDFEILKQSPSTSQNQLWVCDHVWPPHCGFKCFHAKAKNVKHFPHLVVSFSSSYPFWISSPPAPQSVRHRWPPLCVSFSFSD